MSAVKALQQWCKIQCDGYRDVSITNMTTSFRDGLAFCALIHKNRPDLIKFDALKKDDVYDNNKLAFRVAEEELGIPALLDAEDMVALKVPDRLSILTYVSQYYNYFHGRSPIGGMGGVKRPAEGSTEAPSGKKNQPVVSKVFPSSKPAAENLPPPISSSISASAALKPSPTPARAAAQKEVLVERSNQTGTLSSMCAVCQTRVHLVQRQLLGGKLYHRNCAKSVTSAHSNTAVQDLPSKTPVSKYVPHSDRTKATLDPPKPAASSTPAASQLGPSWLTSKADKSKPSATSSIDPAASSPRTVTSVNSNTSHQDLPTSTSGSKYVPHSDRTKATVDPVKSVLNPPKPTASATPAASQFGLSWLTSKAVKPKPMAASSSTNLPASTPLRTASGLSSLGRGSGNAPGSTTTTTTTITTPTITPQPTPAPRTSIGTAKTQQARLKFFQSGPDTTSAAELENPKAPSSKGPSVGGQGQGFGSGKSAVNVAEGKEKLGGKDASMGPATGGPGAKAAAPGKVGSGEENGSSSSSKTQTAALFISKKVTEATGNNDEAKASWSTVVLKKTDNKPVPVDPPKKGSEGVTGRVKLKADMSLLDDLETSPSPPKASKGGLWSRTPDKGSPKPTITPSSTPPASESSSVPSDWRSMLKPVAKETKPVPPSSDGKQTDSLSKPRKSQDFQPPTASSSTPRPSQPSTWGLLNGRSSTPANGPGTEAAPSKTKPDYIPKEEILSELQEIEDNLNELEMRGIELEKQLRSEEEDDSVMDELMVDWFNLIRNKQVAMRRESELVYIAKTQDLEEQQPSVEQELRRLMDTPERLKTSWDKRREKELMDKLVEIINDRNAIVEGLDEDRLREVEEDEELNKLMKNLELKKDKPKKKKFFKWGNKKED
ncbi:MICAL-like protein 2 [Aplochiton taeniatus]